MTKLVNSTKFEVGKKYRNVYSNGIYECLMVTPRGFALFGNGHAGEFLAIPSAYEEHKEPKKGTLWVNVYAGDVGVVHKIRKIADASVMACVEVPWVEGQGLECQGNCTCMGGQPCGKNGCKC